jgi:hypothetical protein
MKKDLKIFLTRFLWDDEDYTGPNIYAQSESEAQAIAEYYGCDVVGELTDVVSEEGECASKKIH